MSNATDAATPNRPIDTAEGLVACVVMSNGATFRVSAVRAAMIGLICAYDGPISAIEVGELGLRWNETKLTLIGPTPSHPPVVWKPKG